MVSFLYICFAVYEETLTKLPVEDLAAITTALGFKSVVASKVCRDKIREQEDYILELRNKIVNLSRELESSKKMNEELSTQNKGLIDAFNVATEAKKSSDEANQLMISEIARLEKTHNDDLTAIEGLRDSIEKSTQAMEDLRKLNADLTSRNAELAQSIVEKDLKIQTLEKNLKDQDTYVSEAVRELKEGFQIIYEKYHEALAQFGARPQPLPKANDTEALLGWLLEEFEFLPGVISSANDFAAVFCTESILKMLETRDCADLSKFRSSGLEFGTASDVSAIRPSADVLAIKKDFIKKFWVAIGKEFATEIVRAKLVKVNL